MYIGVILPHTKLYGGVKRFLELGNIFIERGHEFVVYTVDGTSPTWYDFKGEVKTFDYLAVDDLDALFTTEVRFLNQLHMAKAKRKILYHVRQTEKIKKAFVYSEIEIFACSSNIYFYDKKKYGIEPFRAFGGINTHNYTPKQSYKVEDRPFCIMAYGRLVERVKGTKYVVKACERLFRKGYHVRLLLYDTAVNEKAQRLIDNFSTCVPFDFVQNHPFEKNSELFNRADIFVAAEKHAGWSNSVAEAMACALPVVATESGTRDLLIDEVTGLKVKRNSFMIYRRLKRLIRDEQLRTRLGSAARRNVENFDWHVLASNIESYLEQGFCTV